MYSHIIANGITCIIDKLIEKVAAPVLLARPAEPHTDFLAYKKEHTLLPIPRYWINKLIY
jgi:hypothetical protein